MKVKTFTGNTLEEILPDIREALGSDAVILTQRQKITGGVGGFFGKRQIEVVASDVMPSDEQLVSMEGTGYQASEESMQQEAGGVSTAVKPPARTSGSMVDTWDPSTDDLLKETYGQDPDRDPITQDTARANEAAASNARLTTPKSVVNKAYQPIALEDLKEVIASQNQEAAAQPVIDEPSLPEPQAEETTPVEVVPEPEETAGDTRLTELKRAHDAIVAATSEIENQISTARNNVIKPQSDPSIDRVYSTDSDASATVQAQRPAHLGPVQSMQKDPKVLAALRAIHSRLVSLGVDSGIARNVLEEVRSHRTLFTPQAALADHAREVIASQIPTHSPWDSTITQQRLAVVGPSGTGKSTVVAKLAETYLHNTDYRVGVVSVVGADTSISAYSRQSNAVSERSYFDVQYVQTTNQMMTALDRMADCDVVLFDTPGSAHTNPDTLMSLAAMLATAQVTEVHMVLPLATSYRETVSILDHFNALKTNALIVTKIDESKFIGQLLNFGFRLHLPISYMADGTAIPDDLRLARGCEIADLILPKPKE